MGSILFMFDQSQTGTQNIWREFDQANTTWLTGEFWQWVVLIAYYETWKHLSASLSQSWWLNQCETLWSDWSQMDSFSSQPSKYNLVDWRILAMSSSVSLLRNLKHLSASLSQSWWLNQCETQWIKWLKSNGFILQLIKHIQQSNKNIMPKLYHFGK